MRQGRKGDQRGSSCHMLSWQVLQDTCICYASQRCINTRDEKKQKYKDIDVLVMNRQRMVEHMHSILNWKSYHIFFQRESLPKENYQRSREALHNGEEINSPRNAKSHEYMHLTIIKTHEVQL